MSTGRPVQLQLEIDPASVPVTGTIHDASGRAIEFTGWLGFAAAIEKALSPCGGPASGAPRHLTRSG